MNIFYFLLSLIIFTALIALLGWWKIFVKAGKEPILAFIPIVNCLNMLDVIGWSRWTFVAFSGQRSAVSSRNPNLNS